MVAIRCPWVAGGAVTGVTGAVTGVGGEAGGVATTGVAAGAAAAAVGWVAGGVWGGVAAEGAAVAGTAGETVPLIEAFFFGPTVWRAARVARALAVRATFSSGVRGVRLRGASPKSARASTWPAKATRSACLTPETKVSVVACSDRSAWTSDCQVALAVSTPWVDAIRALSFDVMSAVLTEIPAITMDGSVVACLARPAISFWSAAVRSMRLFFGAFAMMVLFFFLFCVCCLFGWG